MREASEIFLLRVLRVTALLIWSRTDARKHRRDVLAGDISIRSDSGQVTPAMSCPRIDRRYDLLTFQNVGAGPFPGSLIAFVHAALGK